MGDADFIFYAGLLRKQGVWAEGCSVLTCGSTTGHFVRAIAFCDKPETARALAEALSPLALAKPAAVTLADLLPTPEPKP